jgi:hypothetical protein
VSCVPFCRAKSLQRLKKLTDPAVERFWFCRECKQTFRVTGPDSGGAYEVEEIERQQIEHGKKHEAGRGRTVREAPA